VRGELEMAGALPDLCRRENSFRLSAQRRGPARL